jgi:predicted amidohydrolase
MAISNPAVSATVPEFVSLELWAANLEAVTPDLASWLARLEERIAAAAARGSQLLVLPELSCAQWLSFAPHDLPSTGQLGWLAEMAGVALPSMASLAATYGVSLLPGTFPQRVGEQAGVPGFANRAWLFTPDGGAFHQDKLSLTPIEEASASGVTIRGDRVNVVTWNGLRLAMAVCLDVEYTALWARLGRLDLDLILVPAKTDLITGYNRVFTCARSRAIELQTSICAVGAVGAPLGHPATDTGVGGAAAFLPCDVSLHLDGAFAALPPQTAGLATDPVLLVQNLPVGQCRRIRNGAAEAEICPAAWPAEHLRIG